MSCTVKLALHAMATRFELVLHGEDAVRLRAAGEEALRTIERLEGVLSFYRSDSEITLLNRRASGVPMRVSSDVYRLLRACADITAGSDGAFDVTVGPLMRAWRFVGERGAMPQAEDVAAARRRTGMQLVALDDDEQTVQFLRAGVEIDLGAVGKGYAIDAAVADLREAGVEGAFLHGGTSSVHAIGAPPGDDAWRIEWAAPAGTPGPSRIVHLRDGALSVSASHGKAFVHEGHTYGHVLDPRTGAPVARQAACVTGPMSHLCDALSTALLVQGETWLPTLRETWPGYEGWVAG
jgi:thiamine biosynthesis lipoprotein